jgi:hypothetical protein
MPGWRIWTGWRRTASGCVRARGLPRFGGGGRWRNLAKAEVARLRTEVRDDPAAGTRRQRAARQRAACERAARVGAALQAVEALAARQPRQEAESSQPPSETPPLSGAADKKPAEPRASTTDVEARVMKMGDGGFRPAFNVQFATATSSQLIAAVSIGNVGSDQGQLAPMVEQLGERYGQRPSEILVDGGFTKLADIEAVSATGETTVYAPVTKPRDPNRDPHTPQLGDPPGVIAWRARMARPTRRQFTRTVPRRPSASMPWPATAVCNASSSVAWTKPRQSLSGSPWPTT